MAREEWNYLVFLSPVITRVQWLRDKMTRLALEGQAAGC